MKNYSYLTHFPKKLNSFILLEDVILVNYCINKYYNETDISINIFWKTVLNQGRYVNTSFLEYSGSINYIADYWVYWDRASHDFSVLDSFLAMNLLVIKESKEFKDILKNILNPIKAKLILPRLSKVYKQLGASL